MQSYSYMKLSMNACNAVLFYVSEMREKKKKT